MERADGFPASLGFPIKSRLRSREDRSKAGAIYDDARWDVVGGFSASNKLKLANACAGAVW